MTDAEAVELELPAGATVSDVRRGLIEKYPQLSVLVPHAAFAVNSEYADDRSELPAGAEIACIPPVSGG